MIRRHPSQKLHRNNIKASLQRLWSDLRAYPSTWLAFLSGFAVPISIGATPFELIAHIGTATVATSPVGIALVIWALIQSPSPRPSIHWLALASALVPLCWFLLGIAAYFISGGGPIWRLLDFLEEYTSGAGA